MTSTKAIINLTTMDDSLHLPRMNRNVSLLLSSLSSIAKKEPEIGSFFPLVFPPIDLIPLHFRQQAHERNTSAGTDTRVGSE